MVVADDAVAQALQSWNQGAQEAAISTIRPLADEGDPAALHLICWFLHQMGDPRWRDGVPYAKRAVERGDPWALSYYFGFMAEDPALRADLIEMIRLSPTGAFNTNDPIGRATQFANEGDPLSAAALMRAATEPNPPLAPDVEEVRKKVFRLDQVLSEVDQRRSDVIEAIDAASRQVEEDREGFQTRGKTLSELLSNLTNVSSQKFFEDEATKYEEESRKLWIGGVVVLVAAAATALLPLVLSYVAKSHELEGQSSISAHLGAALAFAAVAGVLLSRARSRDRSRQRARDLSVALGTMFTYSEQIMNDEERQRFKHDMGRLVLETFLQQKPPIDDGSRNILSDITAPSAAPTSDAS